jgi:hypothetical protein
LKPELKDAAVVLLLPPLCTTPATTAGSHELTERVTLKVLFSQRKKK